MPHSTRPSCDTSHTFDLTADDYVVSPVDDHDHDHDHEDQRPMTSQSSAYGVAVTSRDERSELPSQRSSVVSSRRKSAPGAHSYADVMQQGGPVQEGGAIVRRGGERENRRSFSYNEESKRRSQYYEEQFLAKNGAPLVPREKVLRQSPVVAELKTNVIIKDEFTLVTDLSRHLAQRYQRPDSCIMIKVDHSACLALGGNFEPCYILSIQALPSQMGAATNKRHAALIQAFMADILSVPSERGIITFVPILEENLAQNGHTVFGEMEKAEKNEVKRVAEATRKSLVLNKSANPLLNGHAQSNGNLAGGSDSSTSVATETPAVPASTAVRNRASSSNSKNGRPSTAHVSGTFDGLRMNPVSVESPIADAGRLPNGRPKTVGAAEPASSVQEELLRREPLPRAASTQSVPLVSRATTTTPSASKHAPTKPEQKKLSSPQPTTTPLAPRPVQTQPKPTATSASITAPTSAPGPTRAKHTPLIAAETRQKNTYLDGISHLTNKSASNKTSPPSPKIVVTPEDDIALPLKANTAKRRSTITATPKLPPPPAEPATDAKSVTSRLSKRKSLLRMFKRSSVPAWYEG